MKFRIMKLESLKEFAKSVMLFRTKNIEDILTGIFMWLVLFVWVSSFVVVVNL